MAFFGGPTTPVSRLEELKRILQKDPTSRQFLALAEEYRRHGKYRDAVITLERGLQLHSTSVAAHVALGRTYQQLDRLEDAIRAFTQALRIDGQNLVAIRHLAEVYLAKGEKLEAVKKLKLYRGLNSGDREVNEIIQKLEGEMSAAVAERPRSGSFPAVSERPEAQRLSPYPLNLTRRAQTIPRLDRSQSPPPPSEPPIPPPPPAESLLVETSPVAVPVAEVPAPAGAPPLVTAKAASIREEPAQERMPFPMPGSGAETDLPEEGATVPFTFPVDLYRTEAAASPFSTPVETAPFDIPDEPPASPAAAETLVSETLADLYRAQGHVADARQTYRTLAETTADEARAEALLEKAASLPEAGRTDHRRLRRLARRFPKRPEATVDELDGLLRGLVERTEGVRAATLTDVEGIPVVTAGPSARETATETLVAELASFLKNVRRTTAETGVGELESLAIAGPKGAAVASRVNAGYSLILQVDPGAALGEIRWEAARTARALGPAVR